MKDARFRIKDWEAQVPQESDECLCRHESRMLSFTNHIRCTVSGGRHDQEGARCSEYNVFFATTTTNITRDALPTIPCSWQVRGA
jgi:hypothetical protein